MVAEPSEHLVVARKYRPASFDQLVGQDQVRLALGNAINSNRVGHAYLFTGARGVGKTSTARIFAKCLNCDQGPTQSPCDACDLCEAVGRGDDVDVIEIDGASNRGIDNIRDLRSNANIRPSRSRFKIYIIDEVHMLSKEAFNALLKTLEEPPAHVKFIFCTTDPEKIPITVLSRCQRYDFQPVRTAEIQKCLADIVAAENQQAEPAALTLLAQRAKGSMRDSQSLLEQVLAFADGKITVEQVNSLLGTADVDSVFDLLSSLANSDTRAALQKIHDACTRGVDPGQLAEQLLGVLRDTLAQQAGCAQDVMLYVTPDNQASLDSCAEQLNPEQLLATMQVIDQALVSMSRSAHPRTLLEMAAVRICSLENLRPISAIVDQLLGGTQGTINVQSAINPATTADASRAAAPSGSVQAESAKKKRDPAENGIPDEPAQAAAEADNPSVGRNTDAPAADSLSAENRASKQQDVATGNETVSPVAPAGDLGLTNEELKRIWKRVLEQMGDMTADLAADFSSIAVSGNNQLVVTLNNEYNKAACERPEKKQRFEQALSSICGRQLRVDFAVSQQTPAQTATATPAPTRRKVIRDLQKHPMVKKAADLFDAEIKDFRRL